MKFTGFILLLIFAGSISFAQTRNIRFETTGFGEIKEKAKKENKLIFVDAFTVWCGPCKWMSANTFTDDSVADYFNARFVNAQIDMEKGEGPEFAQHYKVYCYPNLLFIDGDGNVVHRGAGATDAAGLIRLAEDAQIPGKNFAALNKLYESGKSDPEFIYKYLNAISQTCLPFHEVVEAYFKTVKEEDLISRQNWNIIREYSSDYQSSEFRYLLNNCEKFSKIYTADSVNTKIKYVLINAGYNIVNNPDMLEEDYYSYKKKISAFKSPVTEEVLFYLDLSWNYNKGYWDRFVELAVKKADKFFNTLSDFNYVSWTIYEHSDDRKSLEKASLWMKNILRVKENQEWYAYDTYAALLYKLHNKDEAKKYALHAIELAKTNGVREDDYKSTEELLEKIEKLK